MISMVTGAMKEHANLDRKQRLNEAKNAIDKHIGQFDALSRGGNNNSDGSRFSPIVEFETKKGWSRFLSDNVNRFLKRFPEQLQDLRAVREKT